jgi:hypothetical protein
MSRDGHKGKVFKERFSAVPLSVMLSPAWRWLPPFAHSVCFAVAAQFRPGKGDAPSNNGSLELTEKGAAALGLSRRELRSGIRLLLRVGILVQTVEARRRSGRGIPAKYALTWHPIAANPALNLPGEPRARRAWEAFDPAEPGPNSVNAAEGLLSARAPRAHRNAFSSGTASEQAQAPRGARNSPVRTPRADLAANASGTAYAPPSENLGHPPPPAMSAPVAAAGGGGRSVPPPDATKPGTQTACVTGIPPPPTDGLRPGAESSRATVAPAPHTAAEVPRAAPPPETYRQELATG